MKKLKYKIIDLNEDTHSIVVRYYTDNVTENLLASNSRLRSDGSPERTRSDISITLPIPMPSDDELEKIILRNFPKNGLEVFEKMKTDKTAVNNFKKLKNKLNVEVEKDISEWESLFNQQNIIDDLSTEEIEQLLSSNTA